MIDIEKQNCYRCNKKAVSIEEKTGIILSYKQIDIYLCNECALELANLFIDAVEQNNLKEAL